jgi:hypothetical protein
VTRIVQIPREQASNSSSSVVLAIQAPRSPGAMEPSSSSSMDIRDSDIGSRLSAGRQAVSFPWISNIRAGKVLSRTDHRPNVWRAKFLRSGSTQRRPGAEFGSHARGARFDRMLLQVLIRMQSALPPRASFIRACAVGEWPCGCRDAHVLT